MAAWWGSAHAATMAQPRGDFTIHQASHRGTGSTRGAATRASTAQHGQLESIGEGETLDPEGKGSATPGRAWRIEADGEEDLDETHRLRPTAAAAVTGLGRNQQAPAAATRSPEREQKGIEPERGRVARSVADPSRSQGLGSTRVDQGQFGLSAIQIKSNSKIRIQINS